MPYYAQGDYYRGDYYRGDGILGKIFGGVKRLAGTALKIGVGTALGGPIGGIAASGLAGSGLVRKVLSAAAPLSRQLPGLPPGARALAPIVGGGLATAFGSIANFGSGNQAAAAMPLAVTPADEGPFGPGVPINPMTGMALMRRSRRMNVTNVRALRRAGRRVKGFLKLARSLGALPIGSNKGKRLFKRRRRA